MGGAAKRGGNDESTCRIDHSCWLSDRRATGRNFRAERSGARVFERTIKGSYAFALQGAVESIGPLAASGTTTFDGEGSANITGFVNTTSLEIEASIDGTYVVNPEDCTGSAIFDIPPPGLFGRFTELRFEGVIVGKGEEIRYLITTPGVVFAGTSVRQDPKR